jgi:hypothetical protein
MSFVLLALVFLSRSFVLNEFGLQEIFSFSGVAPGAIMVSSIKAGFPFPDNVVRGQVPRK